MPGEGRGGSYGRQEQAGRRSTWNSQLGSWTGTGGARQASSTSWLSNAGSWSSARSRPARASGTAAPGRPSVTVSAPGCACWRSPGGPAVQGLHFDEVRIDVIGLVRDGSGEFSLEHVRGVG